MKQVSLDVGKKRHKVADDWTAGANEFQMKDAATGNERRPTVCQNVQQLGCMSANGGDQEGTTGPRMTVPDHVVHETPSQRDVEVNPFG